MKPLFPDFDALTLKCAAALMPAGWDTSPDAPGTLGASLAHWSTTGRVCVWDGASDATIFGSAAVNHAFRAWHDWHHITMRAPFDREGERMVHYAQVRDVQALAPNARIAAQASLVLRCENLAQLDHLEMFGTFPADQRLFARRWHAGKSMRKC